MYPPVTSPVLGIFAVLVLIVVAFIEIGVIEYAYHRLGISHRTITILLLLTIVGSFVNIPIATIPAGHIVQGRIVYYFGMPYVVPHVVSAGHTTIAINLGGALIPVCLSAYLLYQVLLSAGGLFRAALATAIVAIIVNRLSHIVPGVGIAVPTLVPGVVAAIAAWLLDRRRAPALAYIAGTMGCLIGADLVNLPLVAQLRSPVVAIGGAGTFDGVFVAGIVAVLLA